MSKIAILRESMQRYGNFAVFGTNASKADRVHRAPKSTMRLHSTVLASIDSVDALPDMTTFERYSFRSNFRES